MFKCLFVLTSIVLLCVVLYFVFYFNQRVVYVSNKFERIKTLTTDNDLSFDCVITGDWNKHISNPIRIENYGHPYNVLFAITSSEVVKKVELLKLSVQYESSICIFKKNHTRSEKYKKDSNTYKYYLDIQNFPILHEVGKTIKLKYKIKVTLKDRIIEKELEAEFKATKSIEKSFIIIDNILSV